jgi:hypothetical protein
MNRQKLVQLIDAVDKEEILRFNFAVIRKGGCGCAIGVAAKLFWNEEGDISNTPAPFTRIQDELELSPDETDVLFNYPSYYKVVTKKGKVLGFGYLLPDEDVQDAPLPTKEEWIAQARKLLEITE